MRVKVSRIRVVRTAGRTSAAHPTCRELAAVPDGVEESGAD